MGASGTASGDDHTEIAACTVILERTDLLADSVVFSDGDTHGPQPRSARLPVMTWHLLPRMAMPRLRRPSGSLTLASSHDDEREFARLHVGGDRDRAVAPTPGTVRRWCASGWT